MRIEDDFGRLVSVTEPKFGTSGLRGLVAEMTDPVCEAHVRGFLAHLRATGTAAARGAGRAGPAAELAQDRGGLPAGGRGPRG